MLPDWSPKNAASRGPDAGGKGVHECYLGFLGLVVLDVRSTEEFAGRLAIEGLDAQYSSDRVRQGSLTRLPYGDATFTHALCLDVLEHLSYEDQPRALAELHRVLDELQTKAGGHRRARRVE